ncbi:DUF2142 domain-containing protein [Candidatus Roizmanbacteria bacterium]|nr:DUF2142 domain-containing protein [Candidatus Roizmanbacteria bacterium]
MFFRKQWLEMYTFILLFLVGLAFVFLVPPFQKPDEKSHFMRTLGITKGAIFCDSKQTETTLENQYLALEKTIDSFHLPNHKNNKFSATVYQKPIFATQNDLKTVRFSFKEFCTYPLLPYLPSTIGIMLGTWFHTNAFITFFLGRLTLFLFIFTAFVWIYKNTARLYKPILLCTFALPMALHQITSYSYDGLWIVSGLAIFSLLFRARIPYFLLCIAFFCLYFSKIAGYELLIFLLFLLPLQKQTIKKQLVLVVLIGGIIVFTKWLTVLAFTTYGVYPNGANPSAQIAGLLGNPFTEISMLVTTTAHRFSFYAQGLIGMFGWLDYGLDLPVYAGYCLAFGILILTTSVPRAKLLSPVQLGILTVILISSYAYILTLFYIVWAKVGAPVTDGVQGRYFLIFFPFFLLLLAQLKSRYFPKLNLRFSPPPILLAILFTAIALSIIHSILSRYFG